MSFILNAIKVFFLFLAECIFDIGISVYSFIITLAETNFFTQEIINSFASRIYVLLGIFMLFKVSFSLVNYIVNPDSFTDKQKGIGKLVPNIMITLVLIVFTPRIFGELMDLQKLVIKEQFIDKIIFGSTDEDSTNLLTNTGGERIAIEIFNSFYYFEDKSDILANSDSNGKYCRYIRYHDAFSTYSDYNAYDGVWDETATYHEFLAIIAAVIFVLVMIQFCFDIAIRTVKLGFLQLIAPIPIMSRIDPKSGKDGMFSRWLKECRITYLNLFIRLIALDFAIVIIQIIMTNYDTNMSEMGFMVKVFLILGTLMFAKQLPKLIKNLFPGFDLDGGFTLNPMKRLKEVPGSHIATAGAAGAVGGLTGMATNLYAGIRAHEGVGKTLRSTVAGGASSLFRTTYSGLKGNKNKPFKAIGAGVKGSVSARNLRDEREIAGDKGIHGVVRRAGVAVNEFSGITSGAARYEKELASYDTALSTQGAIDKLIESEIEKGKSSRTTTFTYTDVNGNKKEMTGNVNVLKQRIDELRNNGGSAEDIQNAEYAYKAALKQAKIDYVNKSFDLVNPKDRDSIEIKETTMDKYIATQVRHMIEEMDYYSKQNSSYDGFKDVQGIANNITRDGDGNIEIDNDGKPKVYIGETWDKFKGAMHGAKDNVISSDTYRQAMANKKLDNKK